MNSIIAYINIVVIASFVSCKNTSVQEELRVVNVLETYMERDSTKIIQKDSSGFNFVHYNGIEIYEEQILQFDDLSTQMEGGETVVNSIVSKDTVFRYYITDTAGSKIFKYNSVDSKDYEIINRDSLFSIFGIDSANLITLNLDLGKPNKVISDKTTNDVSYEQYLFSNPKDLSYPDTLIRMFDNRLKWIKFSHSKILDKKKHSKLVCTRFIYLPRKVKQKDGKWISSPYREDSSLIREIAATRKETYLALIKRFKKDVNYKEH
jgi:hypothetical protein